VKDQDRSKKQHMDESVILRQRLAELEKSEIKHKQAEEALKESQERYEAFFDRSLCCVCVHDFEGRFLDANKGALNLLGYTKKELLSLSLFSLIEEDQLRDAFKTFKEIKKTGSQKKHSEYKLRRKDGSYVWVETEASVIYREGKPYAIQGVGRDITARKRTEEDLLETKNRLHSLFEGIPVGLYRSTPEGKRLDVNRALLRMARCSNREAFLKGNVIDDYLNPEDRKKWQAKMEREGTVRDFKAQCRRHDGTVIWVRDSARTVRDSEGRILYYEGAVEDITERKKAEEKEKQYASNLAFLSRTAMEFVELPRRSDIYKFIGKRLRELVGNSLVLVNSFDDITQCIQVRAFSGVRKEIESIIKILGKNPKEISFPINEEAWRGLTTGRLVRVPGGLHVLSFEKIPKHICNTLEKLLNLGDIYTIGFTKEGKIFGNAVILTRDKDGLGKRNLIETFIGQSSVALQRNRVEEELKRYREHLEERVEERTTNLKAANERLKREITERKKAQQALIESESKLQEQKLALEHKNIALSEIIAQIELEKKKIEDDIQNNINIVVSPIIERLKSEKVTLRKYNLKYVNLLQYHLKKLTSSFGSRLTEKSFNLTPREIEICNMVKGGLASKEISNLLSISHRTIEKHRRNIRQKIGISNKNINLTSFLQKL
jgi:PAS domain S-box-containing protein